MHTLTSELFIGFSRPPSGCSCLLCFSIEYNHPWRQSTGLSLTLRMRQIFQALVMINLNHHLDWTRKHVDNQRANVYTCLWGCVSEEKGRVTLNVLSTVPWARVLDRRRRQKGEEWLTRAASPSLLIHSHGNKQPPAFALKTSGHSHHQNFPAMIDFPQTRSKINK